MGRASSVPPSRNNTDRSPAVSSSSPSGAPFAKQRAATTPTSKTSRPSIIRTSDMSSTLHPSCLLALIRKLFGGTPPVVIGKPTDFVHVKHVGFDGMTGEFTGDRLSTLTEMLSAPVQPPRPEAIRSVNDISRPVPEEVKHITHVTYDEKVGFKNVPEEWRAILLAQGVQIAEDA